MGTWRMLGYDKHDVARYIAVIFEKVVWVKGFARDGELFWK